MRGAIDVAAKAHLNHRPEMTPGVRRAECEKILKDFFKAKRKKHRLDFDREAYDSRSSIF